MSLEFRPFRAGHLTYLVPQRSQAEEHAAVVASGAAAALENPMALSAWRGPRCVGAAGLIRVWPHKAVAWMFLSDAAGSDMLAILRKARRVVAASPYSRVELTVAEDFEPGHRFAQMLGAVRETPQAMRFYGPGAEAQVMYAVLRGA